MRQGGENESEGLEIGIDGSGRPWKSLEYERECEREGK